MKTKNIKWIMASYCMFVLILFSCNFQYEVFDIYLKISDVEILSNNHVGNEWSFSVSDTATQTVVARYTKYQIDKEYLLLSRTSIDLWFKATEHDEYDDIGYRYVNINAGELSTNSLTKDVEVIVTENNGRYSGNSARIRFSYIIRLSITDDYQKDEIIRIE